MGLQDNLVATFRWTDGHADIWPWFADGGLFAAIVEALARPFKDERISKVVGIEARAFLLAGAVARELNAGVVPVRKLGAVFPGPHHSVTTSPDYRGRTIDLLLQDGALSRSDRVLLVDDWLETGSQVLAAVRAVRERGAQLAGVGVIVDDSDSVLDLSVPRFHALIRVEMLGPSA
jgi:adenine phosphoribosyltransferase